MHAPRACAVPFVSLLLLPGEAMQGSGQTAAPAPGNSKATGKAAAGKAGAGGSGAAAALKGAAQAQATSSIFDATAGICNQQGTNAGEWVAGIWACRALAFMWLMLGLEGELTPSAAALGQDSNDPGGAHAVEASCFAAARSATALPHGLAGHHHGLESTAAARWWWWCCCCY